MFWVFVTPALLIFLLAFLGPIIADIVLSFFSWSGVGDAVPVGTKNYAYVLTDPFFSSSLLNTMKLLFICGIITFFLAFLATLGLRQLGRVSKFARSVIFLPNVISPLVFGTLAGLIFAPDGPVNRALRWLGDEQPPAWLSHQNTFTIIMVVVIWTSTGFFVTLIMSAIDQIPASYYEAAELDGAGPLRQLVSVTIPLSWDVVSICAVLWTITAIKSFEIVLVFGGSTVGLPPVETWTSAMYVYQYVSGINSARDFGIASAAAIINLVLIAVLVVVLRRILKRETVIL